MKLKTLFSFTRLPDDSLIPRLNAIHDGLNGNAAFSKPVVDLTVFKTGIDNYAAAVVQSLDGGKQAIATKKKLRGEAIKMAEQLAHYVEANGQGDPQIFTSSGFEIRSTARVPPQPLSMPAIVSLDQGTAGQLLVKLTPVPKARVYEVRWAPVVPAGSASTWTSALIASAKIASPIGNLTPGTTYTFQVRAYGKLGFTDWSNAVQRMVI